MRIAFPLSILVFAGAAAVLSGQGRVAPAPPASIAVEAIPGVIALGTRVELVKGGFRRTEGPVGLPDGSLVFTEMDTIVRIDAAGHVSTFVEKSNAANGLAVDARGRLIAVQRAAGNEKVGVLHPPGDGTVLAASYQGKPFSRLNDLVLDRRGGIYFTDAAGVYYLSPAGSVARVIDGIPNPNGVILSPDEKVLYANNKDGEYLLAFDVAADGRVSNRRNFAKYRSRRVAGHTDPLLAEDNGADGLAVDHDGRLYVTTNLGVEVFGTRGDLLGIIPAVYGGERNTLQKPQNVAFAGADRRTLYLVGAGAVFKVRTIAPGIATRAK